MKNLNQYLAQENLFKATIKSKLLSLDTHADRQEVADYIDCALSPENLHQDGEASPSYVRSRYKLLTGAAKELLTLDPSVKMYEYSV
jgi:hypothetical protein